MRVQNVQPAEPELNDKSCWTHWLTYHKKLQFIYIYIYIKGKHLYQMHYSAQESVRSTEILLLLSTHKSAGWRITFSFLEESFCHKYTCNSSWTWNDRIFFKRIPGRSRTFFLSIPIQSIHSTGTNRKILPSPESTHPGNERARGKNVNVPPANLMAIKRRYTLINQLVDIDKFICRLSKIEEQEAEGERTTFAG